MLIEPPSDRELFEIFCIEFDIDGATQEEVNWDEKKKNYRTTRFLRNEDFVFFNRFICELFDIHEYIIEHENSIHKIPEIVPPQYYTFFSENERLRQALLVAINQLKIKLVDRRHREISCRMEEVVLYGNLKVCPSILENLDGYIFYILEAANACGLFGSQIVPNFHFEFDDFDDYHQKSIPLLDSVTIHNLTLRQYTAQCINAILTQHWCLFDLDYWQYSEDETYVEWEEIDSVFSLFDGFAYREPISDQYPQFEA